MKKIIRWLARVFNANITSVIKETIVKEVEKEVYVYDGDVVRGDLTVEGDLVVEGRLEVYGSVEAKSVSAHGVLSSVKLK